MFCVLCQHPKHPIPYIVHYFWVLCALYREYDVIWDSICVFKLTCDILCGKCLHLSPVLAAVSDVNVLPHDERSLLVQWTSIHSSSVTGYVVEWRPLWKMDPSLILFDHIDRNQSSTLILGMVYVSYKVYIHILWFHSPVMSLVLC